MVFFGRKAAGAATGGWPGGAAVLKLVGIMHCIDTYVAELTMCIGPSMYPTFNPSGDIVVVERFSVRGDKVQRGDVVVSRSPTDPKQQVCKRVIGLPGDSVLVAPGGEGTPHWERIVKIPPGHVWLEGDNPTNSTDSRFYGAVPQALLRGRVVVKLWPLSEMGFVTRTSAPGSQRRKQELSLPEHHSDIIEK